MKKISLFSVKRSQSKVVRPATSSNDVKPLDQHRYKTRDLPRHSRLFWNSMPSVNESIGQMNKDTTSFGVQAGLAVLLFFCAGISSAVAVDRYQSSVFEDEIIECYARMAAASYNDIPETKSSLTCDVREYHDNHVKRALVHRKWHYSTFQEIVHEKDKRFKKGGQSITDVYQRCEDSCDKPSSKVKELVLAFRGTQNDMDQLIDKNSESTSLS